MAEHNNCRGFTLLEIAVVLLVVGLLVGALLASRELMDSAKVRALVGALDSARTAYYGFVDRYRGPPGDYPRATLAIPNASVDGNGNGRIEPRSAGAAIDEHIAAWEHLGRAGFLVGPFVYDEGNETAGNAPSSVFGAYMRLVTGADYAGRAIPRDNVNSGNFIPASVLAEADRKMDDGIATTGKFRFSTVATTGPAPTLAHCVRSGGAYDGHWQTIGQGDNRNCGATWLLE